jgi:hypothetical protein
MSRKSRRRNKVLAAMVGLAGASKLGLIGKMPTSVTGDKFATARKAMTSNKAMRGASKPPMLGNIKDKVVAGITKLKRSDLPSKRNMKSIFVGDDGSITKGLEKFKNKDVYSKTMKSRRGETNSLKDFANKFILGRKTQLNKGKMVEARGGGMARNKPTKLY